ncbi:DUF3857 domain-containing protein [Hymenobacter properus]|uniref:DUF3857 domain-containing protein n=1 Tax=Hymenobacter properus TaxID=2791026 RepID=A0A931FPD2_9BACT|nr:DUF3857 domain-containing protein [Hymenobacter properus]MBF9143504.1 DUF3857 domain-containing protein [Hymenobacter properus]MBR7722317.1 DUF3857 domain-containing protein [Microvirga sp. SRT04]
MPQPHPFWAALALVLLSPFAAQAQPEPIKFGQVNQADLTAAPFGADSAAAVVLCDYGAAQVKWGADGSMHSETERMTRVKILRKAGYRYASLEIPLVGGRKLTGLRGFTYNLVNGVVEKTKLESAGEFTEEIATHVRVFKCTLPNVREGSVVEFAYSLTAGGRVSLPDWQFQHEVPVRWSEFRIAYPDIFNFKTVLQGYLPLAVREQKEGTARVMLSRWAMKDVPALREEPYVTTMNDYVARLDLELASVNVPGRVVKDFLSSWEQVDADLLHDPNLGQLLNQGGFLSADLAKLALPATATVEERAAAVHALVRGAVKYDGLATTYASTPLRKLYTDTHRGNAAEINLLLIAALRAAKLDANPVLLSTREHGRVAASFPMASRFNYVVAHVALPDGKDLLLDATEPLLPCGMLPERCLNGVGRLVMANPQHSRWVELTPSQRRVHFQQAQLDLTPQGGLSGKVHEEFSGYAGATARAELEKDGEPKYRTHFASKHGAWTVPQFAVSQRTNLLKPLTLDYAFEQPADAAATPGSLYLSPVSEFLAEQNPFRLETRTFPVDFGTQQDETLMITLHLPADYELADRPKPSQVELPDGGGRFFYSVAVEGSTVNITSRLSLRKPVYAAEEYVHLRELYRLMLEKQREKLVIKKKA